MTYKKEIVCLANSRKLNGRCVAGLELQGDSFGEWIRPVSGTEKGELRLERFYQDGSDPKLLDKIEIQFAGSRATDSHPEDHLIQSGRPWLKKGSISRESLKPAIENVRGCLWYNGGSSRNGLNDVIPAEAAANLGSSLKLIQPNELTMTLRIEGADFGRARRMVRGQFSIGGFDYLLSVTDPVVENEFRSSAEGTERRIVQPILCLSVSEVFEKQNACYKLIAGVIE